ncbi:MAG TPA: Rrf2 family transcriptional regulator [Kiritimatiellia bacterium]|nr:Rrf2 family transcriptional regulator [Kiritimatiellia bacterium]
MLSKKVEYGLISLLYMSSLGKGEVVSTKDLGERFHLPVELLGKVLQALARSGLVEAVQGAKGGYKLAKGLEGITLGDVIESIEGPVKLTRCIEDPAGCSQFEGCVIKDALHGIHQQLAEFINGVSLASLRSEPQEAMVL